MRRRNVNVLVLVIILLAAGLTYNWITSTIYELQSADRDKWYKMAKYAAHANDNVLAQRIGTISKRNVSFMNCQELVQKTGSGLNKDDFCNLDLVAENMLVDKLSPMLSSNHEVIEEAQRIHWNMFKTLIGHYKYAMLFNFAAFENKGDPAITVGELNIIRKLGIELIFHCPNSNCKVKTLKYAKTISKGYSSQDLVILMQGGGNLLSYEIEDEKRRLVLETFPEFEIILFPQSVWPRANAQHQKRFQDIYSKHPRLTFLYRDRDSYDLGKQMFPKARPLLMPDMAFEIGAVSRFLTPTHDIVWLKRGDIESPKYNVPNNKQGYDVLVADWCKWLTPKGSTILEDPFLIAANGMLFLQRGRVVITDRLHGHILSTLCGIPHVVIDPVNHKLTSYMKSWTGGIENIKVTYTAEDALNKAIELLQKLDDKIPEVLTFRNSTEYKVI